MSTWKGLGRYGTVGFDLILSMAVGFYGGRYLDTHYFGSKGWATAIGSILGIAAGFRNLFRAAKLMEKQADNEDREGTGVPYSEEYLEAIDKDKAEAKAKAASAKDDTTGDVP